MLVNGVILDMSVRECFSREVTVEHTGSGWVSHQIIWEEEYSRCETSKYKGSEGGAFGGGRYLTCLRNTMWLENSE